MEPTRARPDRLLYLAWIATIGGCGGALAPTGRDALDAGASPSSTDDAAASAEANPDAGAILDAAPCTVPMMPLPVPGPGECLMPSGRLCAGSCICDDGCNTCWCRDGGGLSMTDLACPSPVWTPTGCATTAVTPSCRSVGPYDPVCADAGSTHYCNASVLAACGANSCPEVGCTPAYRDGVGGSYWCCP